MNLRMTAVIILITFLIGVLASCKKFSAEQEAKELQARLSQIDIVSFWSEERADSLKAMLMPDEIDYINQTINIIGKLQSRPMPRDSTHIITAWIDSLFNKACALNAPAVFAKAHTHFKVALCYANKGIEQFVSYREALRKSDTVTTESLQYQIQSDQATTRAEMIKFTKLVFAVRLMRLKRLTNKQILEVIDILDKKLGK